MVCTRAAAMTVDEFLLQVLGDGKRHWGDLHEALQHHGVLKQDVKNSMTPMMGRNVQQQNKNVAERTVHFDGEVGEGFGGERSGHPW